MRREGIDLPDGSITGTGDDFVDIAHHKSHGFEDSHNVVQETCPALEEEGLIELNHLDTRRNDGYSLPEPPSRIPGRRASQARGSHTPFSYQVVIVVICFDVSLSLAGARCCPVHPLRGHVTPFLSSQDTWRIRTLGAVPRFLQVLLLASCGSMQVSFVFGKTVRQMAGPVTQKGAYIQ